MFKLKITPQEGAENTNLMINYSGSVMLNRTAVARRLGLLAIILFTALFVGYAYKLGQVKGWDRFLPLEGWGRYQFAIGVNTAERFGFRGYVLPDFIETELAKNGITEQEIYLSKLGSKYPDNFKDEGLLGRAFHALGNGNIPAPLSASLRGTSGDDIGLVDYVRFAFLLFGNHVSSFYLTLFFTIVLSTLAAFWDLRRSLIGATAIMIGTAGLLLSFHFSGLFDRDFYTPTDPRFLGVIGIIPLIHVYCATFDKAEMSRARALALLLQGSLIFLACHIRASAAWQPASIVVLLLAVVALRLLQAKWAGNDFTLRKVLRADCLPALIVLITYLAWGAAVELRLNPLYNSGGYIRQHAMWHSIYYSLAEHPDFATKYAPDHDGLQKSDAMPFAGIRIYFRDHPEDDAPKYYRDGVKVAPGGNMGLSMWGMEVLSRKAFFHFASKDPRFVFETFFYYKPKALLKITGDVLKKEITQRRLRGPVIAGILIGALVIALAANGIPAALGLLGIMTVASLGALAINLITVVSLEVMGDQLTVVTITVLFALSLVCGLIIRALIPYAARLAQKIPDRYLTWLSIDPAKVNASGKSGRTGE